MASSKKPKTPEERAEQNDRATRLAGMGIWVMPDSEGGEVYGSLDDRDFRELMDTEEALATGPVYFEPPGLPKGEIAGLKKLGRTAVAEFRSEQRRRERDHDRMSGGDVITTQNAIDAMRKQDILCDWTYYRPGGAREYQDIVDHQESYYPPGAEDIIHEYRPARTSGIDLYLVGGGTASKEIRQGIRGGGWHSITDLDESTSYSIMAREKLIEAGYSERQIRLRQGDFFKRRLAESLFNRDFWNKHVRPARMRTRRAIFSMLGATFGNPTTWNLTELFARRLRGKMLAGDGAFLGIDSTIKRELLLAAYSGPRWEKMMKNNLRYVVEKKLRLKGLDLSKIDCRTTVEKENGHYTVYIRLDCRRHPKLQVAELNANNDHAAAIQEIADNFPKYCIITLRSRRTPMTLVRKLFKACGLKVVAAQGIDNDVMVESPLRLPEDNKWHKRGVRYNIWYVEAVRQTRPPQRPRQQLQQSSRLGQSPQLARQ